MKKILLLSLLAASVLTTNAQQSVTIDDFSACVSAGSFANPPEGWATSGSGTTFSIDAEYGLYGYSASGNTYIITPALIGTVSVTGKVTAGEYDYWTDEYLDDGTLKFYEMTANDDGTYTRGTQITDLTITSTGALTTKSSSVTPGTRVGILLGDAHLKSITYTPIPADGEYSLPVINSVAYPEDVTDDIKADYENNVAYTLNVTVTNGGTKALNPGDAGYVFTVFEKSAPDVALGTYTPTEAIAPGEQKTFTITGTFPMTDIMQDKEPGNNGAYWRCLCVKEGMSGAYQQADYKDFWPNWFLYETISGTEPVSSLDFGIATAGTTVTKTITLRNKCINPLEVSWIAVPEGYTLNTTIPFTVNPVDQENHEAEISVTMNAEAAGVIAGNMDIYVGGAEMPATVSLTGASIGGDYFYEDFEGETLPAGWIINSALSLNEGAPAVMGEGNVQYLHSNSYYDIGYAITPRLSAQEGEYLVFQAASNTKSSINPYVTVYYSTDRNAAESEWTQLMKIKNVNQNSEGEETFSSEEPTGYSYDGTALKLFSVAVPEGEGYLKFEILQAHIDNVFGLHEVAVDHDLMFNEIKVNGKTVVNNTLNVAASIKNVADAEAAGSYTLTLLANGEPVAEMTETPELINGDNNVIIGYTPHSAGDVTLKVQLTAGDYTISSAEIAATIAEESLDGLTTVGTGTCVSSGSGIETTPIHNYYKKSEAHMVYTEEQLAAAGVTAGTEISGISFFGANQETGKDLVGPVTVWMQPTELATLSTDAAPTTSDDNKVYYNENYTCERVGTKDAPVESLRFDFTEPYVYNGGNLLVTVRKVFEVWSSNTSFVINQSITNQSIIRYTDNGELDSESFKTADGLAQLGIHYALAPATYSGTVVNSNDNTPVEGAQISLTSDQVLYSGVSAADGTFSIDVVQGDKDYTVTVEKESFNTYTADVTFADGNVTATIQLIPTSGVGVEGVNADTLNIRIEADVIYVDGIERANMTIYNTNGMAVASAEGNSISTAELQGGIYILSVDSELGKANVRFIKR